MADSEIEEGEVIESFENSIGYNSPSDHSPLLEEVPLRQKRGRSEEKVKKAKCRYWATGTCHKGDDCPFWHEDFASNDLCKYILAGSCLKGEKCMFSHETHTYPCKYFHSIGLCQAGDSCAFSHAPISPEMMPRFLKDNEQFLIRVQRSMSYSQFENMPSLLPYPYPIYPMWVHNFKPPSPDLSVKLRACGIIKLKSISMPPAELVKKRSIPDRKQIFKHF